VGHSPATAQQQELFNPQEGRKPHTSYLWQQSSPSPRTREFIFIIEQQPRPISRDFIIIVRQQWSPCSTRRELIFLLVRRQSLELIL